MFAMAKRIFLFVTVNILVVFTLSLILNLLGVRPYLEQNDLNFQTLLIFCSVFGFGGAFISLLISRFMAKMAMGVKVIDPRAPKSSAERELLQTVHRLCQKEGFAVMPEVGLYESPEVNAFATGPSKSKALVAVSTGLLSRMDSAAVEGVLGHEVAHIANGDMVTMTLLQGIVNTFVMFFARVAAWVLTNAMSSRSDRESSQPSPFMYYIVTQLFEFAFMLLGMIVINYFSRLREFRADRGGANLAGREKMIHALQSLKASTQWVDTSHPALATLKISGKRGGLAALFSTHPDLDVRIEALRRASF